MRIRIKKLPQQHEMNARKWKHGLGGNLFSGEDTPTQQMQNGLNLFRNTNKAGDVWYTYQESPDSEEIRLTPINTLLDDPAQWTYVDEQGRQYSPRSFTGSQAVLDKAEDVNPLVRAANNYFREAAYRAKDGTLALQGKYIMPAIALTATGIGGFIDSPIAATGALVEGDLAGKGVNWLSSIFTGNDWGENVSKWTGLDYTPAIMTNPGYIIGGQAGYSGGRTIARGVKQDRLLGKNYSPEEAAAYQSIYGRDIQELQNQTAISALLNGSPNLGNEYGIFNGSNPIYYPRNFTSWLAEAGNYTLPFAGPLKTPARIVARNMASQSSSPERLKADWYSATHKGSFDGIIGSDTGFQSDIEKAYPGINFVDYYLWRDDPILRWAPSVRTTARYFKENPAPFRTSFGEKYDLYGDISQGQMPLKSVNTHLQETTAFSLPGYKASPFKTGEGITQLGISRMQNAHNYSEDIGPLKLGEWSGMDDLWNSSVPELNIAGHQVFVDPANSEVLSRDIWKYNPWDWKKKWGTLGGKAAQAGIMDKLGTPFITTARVPLSSEAIIHLNQYK